MYAIRSYYEGELELWKLAIKPGKPLTVGRYRGVPVIGLPGNPASSLVTFALLGRPYLFVITSYSIHYTKLYDA